MIRLRWARRLLALVAAVLVTAALAPATAHATPTDSALCDDLAALVAEQGARVGYVVLDLDSGSQCTSGESEVFRSASLYKLLVMIEAYEQAARGEFAFDETLTLEARHTLDDPPGARIATPRQIEAREAVRLMITRSDNTTALALLERLGPERVGEVATRLSLRDTTIPGAFETSARDIARIYELLYAGRLVSPGASAEMLALLRHQEVVDLIPAALPAGVEVAHKTGIVDHVLHDAGIVTAPGGDYVVVLLTEWSTGLPQSYSVIRALSGRAWAAFETPRAVTPAVRMVLDTPPVPLADDADGGGATLNLIAPPSAAATSAVAAPIAVTRSMRPLSGSEATWQYAAVLALTALAVLGAAPLVGRFAASRLQGSSFLWVGRPLMVEAGDSGNPLRESTAPYANFASDAPVRRRSTMRFGSRAKAPELPPVEIPRERAPEPEATPAAPPVTPVPAAVAPPRATIAAPSAPETQEVATQRLRRLADYFLAEGDLLEQMRQQVEIETAPLVELLLKQRGTMETVLENLDERLRPLREYAAGEEANLASLEERLTGGGAEFLARSFADYIGSQRQRVDETRQRIEHQRQPFIRFQQDQRDIVETALTRFDDDIEQLEKLLAEQRTVMTRMLDAMRSDAFHAAKDFLAEREDAMGAVAAGKITDPAAIGEALRAARNRLGDASDKHVSTVLQATDAADRRLIAASPTGTAPRTLRSVKKEPGPAAEAEDSEAATN